MTDVNIVADGNTARLLGLECKRLELEHITSSSPVSDAKLYIIDFNFYSSPIPFPSKTIAIDGKEKQTIRFNLSNPFLLSELRKYIREIITAEHDKVKYRTAKKQISAPKLSLDAKNQCAILRGKKISLSQTEFKILEALLDKKGDILSHSEINELIGGAASNKANVYICFLRKKLESHGEKIIYSVRGKGFNIRKDK